MKDKNQYWSAFKYTKLLQFKTALALNNLNGCHDP